MTQITRMFRIKPRENPCNPLDPHNPCPKEREEKCKFYV